MGGWAALAGWAAETEAATAVVGLEEAAMPVAGVAACQVGTGEDEAGVSVAEATPAPQS